MSKRNKPFSKSEVRRLLTNRLFMGVMLWKGEIYEGKFKVIVSGELFAKVQRVLKTKSKPSRTRKGHNFPFCGVFRCTCGSMITAQWARGKSGGLYRYYRCTRKNGPCSEAYLREELVAEQCLERLRPLAITAPEAAEIQSLISWTGEKEVSSLTQGLGKLTETLSSYDENSAN